MSEDGKFTIIDPFGNERKTRYDRFTFGTHQLNKVANDSGEIRLSYSIIDAVVTFKSISLSFDFKRKEDAFLQYSQFVGKLKALGAEMSFTEDSVIGQQEASFMYNSDKNVYAVSIIFGKYYQEKTGLYYTQITYKNKR